MNRARLAWLGGLVAGCTGVDVGTSPYAHETPPIPMPFASVHSARYLGGSGLDRIADVVVAGGGIVVVGGTASPDFPTTDGSTVDGSTPAGCSACPFDGFVAMLELDGSPRWIRLLSSPGYDHLTAVVTDPAATRLFVAGSSGERAGLAGWHGGLHPERGEQDGLICELALADGAIVACRYLGGDGPGGVADLAFAGDVQGPPAAPPLVAALTVTATEALHLDPAYSAAFAGRARPTSDSADGVVLGLGLELAAADNLRWASYVGGSGDEGGTPAVAHGGTTVYYLGETTSTDVPVPGGLISTAPPARNAFLAALSVDGATLVHGTYLGGDGDDLVAPGSLVAALSDVTVGLTTTSTDLPSTSPYHGGGATGCGDGDIWLLRLDTSRSGALTSRGSSYVGGQHGDQLGGLSPGSDGFTQLVLAGSSHSFDFPVQGAQPLIGGALCTANPGNSDGVAAGFGGELGLPTGGSFLGGRDAERATAVDGRGPIVVVGVTASTSFPVVGAAGTSFRGGEDGFIAVFGSPGPGSGDAGGGGDGPGDDESAGCCGASPAPAPGMLGLAGLVLMMLVRRRRGR